jgi:hypothetical protein
MERCPFEFVFIFKKNSLQHHIQEYIFNTLSSNLHFISFQSNSIWTQLNQISIQMHIQFNSSCNAMSFNIFIQMELNFHKIN